eukprot:363998-Chlamydomonas_euryale.AAC.8
MPSPDVDKHIAACSQLSTSQVSWAKALHAATCFMLIWRGYSMSFQHARKMIAHVPCAWSWKTLWARLKTLRSRLQRRKKNTSS